MEQIMQISLKIRLADDRMYTALLAHQMLYHDKIAYLFYVWNIRTFKMIVFFHSLILVPAYWWNEYTFRTVTVIYTVNDTKVHGSDIYYKLKYILTH